MKSLLVTVLAAVSVVSFINCAVADDDERHNRDLRVEPFQFGRGALVGWIRGAGEPDNRRDPSNYGLYLQKSVPTSNYAAAGANLYGIPRTAARLQELSFDISGVAGVGFDESQFGEPPGSTHGYCGAGAPRFNVFSDGGTCFLGCIYGTKTQDPETGWWTIKFAPVSTAPGLGCGGTNPQFDGTVAGNITGIQIVFDEGTEVGPGNVVIDNIRVNDDVVGKPRGDRDD
jgi:hypothetical protein